MKRLARRLGAAATAIVLSIGLGACAGAPKRVSVDPTKTAFLFPYGNYVHQVKLSLPSAPDPTKRKFEFRGAVKIGAEAIRVVVLSPIGTTILTMNEDRATGKVETKAYVDQLKPYEKNLAEYYASLRVILTMPRTPGPDVNLDASGRPARMERPVGDRLTKFEYSAYDEHGIPTSIRIENDRFQVDVKVLGYEI